MIETVVNIVSGGMAGVMAALVVLWLGRKIARSGSPDPHVAMCSCGHGAGMHARAGSDLAREFGVCRAVIKSQETWNDSGGMPRYRDASGQCACEHYDGPDPDQLRLLRGA